MLLAIELFVAWSIVLLAIYALEALIKFLDDRKHCTVCGYLDEVDDQGMCTVCTQQYNTWFHDQMCHIHGTDHVLYDEWGGWYCTLCEQEASHTWVMHEEVR